MVDPFGRHVGGNHHHFQTIDLLEFKGFGVGGTGHARQLVVNSEIVLEGSAGQRLALRLDADAFFGFDRLMVALAPTTTGHGTAGVLVNDHDLIALDDVLNVLLEHHVGAHCGVDVVEQHQVLRGIQAVALGQQSHFRQDTLDPLHAGFGELD